MHARHGEPRRLQRAGPDARRQARAGATRSRPAARDDPERLSSSRGWTRRSLEGARGPEKTTTIWLPATGETRASPAIEHGAVKAGLKFRPVDDIDHRVPEVVRRAPSRSSSSDTWRAQPRERELELLKR